MVIIYCEKSIGWSPVAYMVKLAVHLFDAELVMLEYRGASLGEKLSTLFLKRKNRQGEKLLIVCPSPTELSLIFQEYDFRSRFDCITAWVFDSFWVDRIPWFVKKTGLFDHFFITSREDVEEWEKLTNTPTTWIPWGADVLGLGGVEASRKWDLVRVGRQPKDWDDDDVTQGLCRKNNICFGGRPDFFEDAIQNQKAMMSVYQQAKFILAFSNIANPESYTHPTREYLTARWVDALACGSVVAGISPQEASISELLWDGATLELGTVNATEGMAIISEALSVWTQKQADYNYYQSLKYLDWRWRFMDIANLLELSPKKLLLEVEQLNFKITNAD